MKHNIRDFEDARWSKWSQSIEFRHRSALDLLDPGSVLDVGCGDGLFLSMAKEKISNGTGLDISAEGIRQAREKNPNMTFIHTENARLPFDDNSFETVVALDVLEHTLQPEELLRELRRVSAHFVIISVPNFSSFPARLQTLFGKVPENNTPKKGHVYWFTLSVLKDMIRSNGLKIVDMRCNYQGSQIPIVRNIVSVLTKFFPQVFALSFVVKMQK